MNLSVKLLQFYCFIKAFAAYILVHATDLKLSLP